MWLSLTIGAAAFVVTWVAIWLLRHVAIARGWVDTPGSDPLKIHSRPIPLVGGPGIVLGSLVALLLAAGLTGDPLAALVSAPAVIVAVLGFYDDLVGLRQSVRLVVEVAAVLILVIVGAKARVFELPVLAGGALGLTAFAVLVLLYVVGGINAVNMQDGLDGMAGGLTLISCAGFVLVAARLGDAFSVQVSAALAGSLCGFLVFNLPPASVFMGDCGSYFLGFAVASLALLLGAKSGTVMGFVGGILLVGVPVLDAAAAVGRRLLSGESPFSGDRRHFYDRLLQRGYDARTTLLIGCLAQTVTVGGGTLLVARP